MTKVEYYIQSIQITKHQDVQIVFKRLPTTEQLKKFQEDMKSNDNNTHQMVLKAGGIMNIIEMYEEFQNRSQIQLRFDSIPFVIPLKDFNSKKLTIGKRVKLNIPEVIEDIVI